MFRVGYFRVGLKFFSGSGRVELFFFRVRVENRVDQDLEFLVFKGVH